MVDQARSELTRMDGIDDEQVEDLIRHGFRSAQELFDAEPYEVAGILDMEEDEAEKVIDEAERILDQLILEEAKRRADASEVVEDLPEEA